MIAHISIWSKDVEALKNFYTTYFECQLQELYFHKTMLFKSYFLTFPSGAKLELIPSAVSFENKTSNTERGFSQVSISVGSKSRLYKLYSVLLSSDTPMVRHPVKADSGYYELVVLDPEQNRIAVTN
ncbi:VOC family protein [Alishewanella longhuensis]|uniref:VOC family protein n=1 Tax=Alishewanella longhuensis TaxID=1091037 RepID=UPI0016718BBD|nr:VOC family protein [Alishewanella longhuensis]